MTQDASSVLGVLGRDGVGVGLGEMWVSFRVAGESADELLTAIWSCCGEVWHMMEEEAIGARAGCTPLLHWENLALLVVSGISTGITDGIFTATSPGCGEAVGKGGTQEEAAVGAGCTPLFDR